MTDRLFDIVPGLLRGAANTHLLPRWQRLASGEVSEKSPGERVTVVDRELEAALSPQLAALLPGSRCVGEEACALAPGLLEGLEQGDVWVLDPLDGTANFIAGRPSVAVMVALLRNGETIAGWMLNPLTGAMHAAERGSGAWCGDVRLRSEALVPPLEDGLVGVVKTQYLPEPWKSRAMAGLPALREQRPSHGCAGDDYPAVVRGEVDFTLYWRTLPWDHAPGALLVQEAGGRVARLDGSPYRPGDGRTGLIVAPDAARWRAASDWFTSPR